MTTMEECTTPRAETKLALGEEEPQRPYYAALDIKALGEGINLKTGKPYPVVALGIGIVDRTGKRLAGYGYSLPVEINEDAIEPRCAKEFWYNRNKVSQKVFDQLVSSCAAARQFITAKIKAADEKHLAFPCEITDRDLLSFAWQDIAREIDGIYRTWGTGRAKDLIWVGDCLDFDYGRTDALLLKYAGRTPVRYDPDGVRHWIEDCSSGRWTMEALAPEKHRQMCAMQKTADIKHDHDPTNDALSVATKYAHWATVLRDSK